MFIYHYTVNNRQYFNSADVFTIKDDTQYHEYDNNMINNFNKTHLQPMKRHKFMNMHIMTIVCLMTLIYDWKFSKICL